MKRQIVGVVMLVAVAVALVRHWTSITCLDPDCGQNFLILSPTGWQGEDAWYDRPWWRFQGPWTKWFLPAMVAAYTGLAASLGLAVRLLAGRPVTATLVRWMAGPWSALALAAGAFIAGWFRHWHALERAVGAGVGAQVGGIYWESPVAYVVLLVAPIVLWRLDPPVASGGPLPSLPGQAD